MLPLALHKGRLPAGGKKLAELRVDGALSQNPEVHLQGNIPKAREPGEAQKQPGSCSGCLFSYLRPASSSDRVCFLAVNSTKSPQTPRIASSLKGEAPWMTALMGCIFQMLYVG